MEEERELILAVDDHPDALYALERILGHNGYGVLTASSGMEAIEKAREGKPSLVLLDVMMPLMDGYEVTREFKRDPELRYIPLVLVTAKSSLEDVVEGLNRGADGYITKPFRPEELLARVRASLRLRSLYEELRQTKAQNETLLREISGKYDFSKIIGKSRAIKSVFAILEKVVKADTPVLITGPSGTGKELVARAIHFNSKRKSAPFIAKNCAAFAEQLLESELFGHVKGAFTGAVKDKKGLFEAADGGTLFLDEVGEMSPVLQAKLLRVLQEGTFMLVGATSEKKVDVRVLAATHRDLLKMADEGSFREDLYYRLNVINIQMPPLSEREGDIPVLVDYFLEKFSQERGQKKPSLSDELLSSMQSYAWRGNVRELQNEIERLLILGDGEDELGAELLSPHILRATGDISPNNSDKELQTGSSLKIAIEDLERKMIEKALKDNEWNKSNAAKQLGISRSSLISKVQLFGLESS